MLIGHEGYLGRGLHAFLSREHAVLGWDKKEDLFTLDAAMLARHNIELLINLLGHWLIGLPIGVTLGFGLKWGATGLWLGLVVGLASVAILLWREWGLMTGETGSVAKAPLTASSAV